MGQDDVGDARRVDVRRVELTQDAVAAAGVHQQDGPAEVDGKTGVVAARGQGVAGTEHNEGLCHGIASFFSIIRARPRRVNA